jgi:hypothetical protein
MLLPVPSPHQPRHLGDAAVVLSVARRHGTLVDWQHSSTLEIHYDGMLHLALVH